MTSEENRKRPLEDAKEEKRLKRPDRKANADRGLQEVMEEFEKGKRALERQAGELYPSFLPKEAKDALIVANAAEALIRFFFAGETELNSAIYFTDPTEPEQSLALGVLKGEERLLVFCCNLVLESHIDKDKWKKFVDRVKIRENPKLKFIIHSARTHIIFGHEQVQRKSISNKNFVNFWPDISVAGIAPMVAYFDPRE